MLVILVCSNGMLVQAANEDVSVTSMQATSGLTQEIKNPYGITMYLDYTFQYSDGNSVIFTGVNYRYPENTSSANMINSNYTATSGRQGDCVYVTVVWKAVSGTSFETKVWCDIYGDNGVIY